MKPTAIPSNASPSAPRPAQRDADVVRLEDLLTPPTPAPSPAVKVWNPDAENKVREIGGRQNGLDPTRYGDWEKNGRCIDF
ncbi:DUF1674 domain-containing protein [Polycyclovorans algicola]|uniref:DUF1674 domain-containing protein n=1 Tax=Polycyclovorans algicola TaxID=616992 RepID=UPI001F39A7D1|nr:DUF1674 domain-containing protein [Polycyclovorans algicola]